MTSRESQSSKSDHVGHRVQPVNLREQYGHRYQIDYDPAFYAEHGRRTQADDAWLQIIPGRHGHIFPFGGESLAASTNHHGRVANKLLGLPCCEVWQDGSDGVTVLFHIRDLRKVGRIIGARTTRKLGKRQRVQLVAAGAAYRFGKLSDATHVAQGEAGIAVLSADSQPVSGTSC